MKVWKKTQKKDGKIWYFHVFTGDRKKNGLVTVRESLLRFSDEGRYFTPPGDEVFVGSQEQFEYSDIQRMLVQLLFRGKLNLETGSFQ